MEGSGPEIDWRGAGVVGRGAGKGSHRNRLEWEQEMLLLLLHSCSVVK